MLVLYGTVDVWIRTDHSKQESNLFIPLAQTFVQTFKNVQNVRFAECYVRKRFDSNFASKTSWNVSFVDLYTIKSFQNVFSLKNDVANLNQNMIPHNTKRSGNVPGTLCQNQRNVTT